MGGSVIICRHNEYLGKPQPEQKSRYYHSNRSSPTTCSCPFRVSRANVCLRHSQKYPYRMEYNLTFDVFLSMQTKWEVT